METGKENIIVDLTSQFGLEIIDFTEELSNNKKYNLSNQLFRSGTSIGANTKEAQNAESKADFIHKLKIAAKEAEETKYWLLICLEMGYIKENKLLLDLEVICKILGKIISSSKAKIS